LEPVEDAYVVYDESLGFAGVGAVYAGDGLEEVVVSEGFVEVHGFEYGGVEAGEEHVADDEYPRVFVSLLVVFASDVELFGSCEVVGFEELLHVGVSVSASAEDDCARGWVQVVV